jgi:hypothetical protein
MSYQVDEGRLLISEKDKISLSVHSCKPLNEISVVIWVPKQVLGVNINKEQAQELIKYLTSAINNIS